MTKTTDTVTKTLKTTEILTKERLESAFEDVLSCVSNFPRMEEVREEVFQLKSALRGAEVPLLANRVFVVRSSRGLLLTWFCLADKGSFLMAFFGNDARNDVTDHLKQFKNNLRRENKTAKVAPAQTRICTPSYVTDRLLKKSQDKKHKPSQQKQRERIPTVGDWFVVKNDKWNRAQNAVAYRVVGTTNTRVAFYGDDYAEGKGNEIRVSLQDWQNSTSPSEDSYDADFEAGYQNDLYAHLSDLANANFIPPKLKSSQFVAAEDKQPVPELENVIDSFPAELDSTSIKDTYEKLDAENKELKARQSPSAKTVYESQFPRIKDTIEGRLALTFPESHGLRQLEKSIMAAKRHFDKACALTDENKELKKENYQLRFWDDMADSYKASATTYKRLYEKAKKGNAVLRAEIENKNKSIAWGKLRSGLLSCANGKQASLKDELRAEKDHNKELCEAREELLARNIGLVLDSKNRKRIDINDHLFVEKTKDFAHFDRTTTLADVIESFPPMLKGTSLEDTYKNHLIAEQSLLVDRLDEESKKLQDENRSLRLIVATLKLTLAELTDPSGKKRDYTNCGMDNT